MQRQREGFVKRTGTAPPVWSSAGALGCRHAAAAYPDPRAHPMREAVAREDRRLPSLRDVATCIMLLAAPATHAGVPPRRWLQSRSVWLTAFE